MLKKTAERIHRGKMRKAKVDPSFPPIIADETSFVPSRGWAEMIFLDSHRYFLFHANPLLIGYVSLL